jgi:hypothetical protein
MELLPSEASGAAAPGSRPCQKDQFTTHRLRAKGRPAEESPDDAHNELTSLLRK